MTSKMPHFRSRFQSTHGEMRNLFGWLILTALTLGITVLLRLPLTWTLPVVCIFLLASIIELFIAAFALPYTFREFFPGIALLILCVWLISNDGSPLLLTGIAFTSGWIFHSIATSFD